MSRPATSVMRQLARDAAVVEYTLRATLRVEAPGTEHATAIADAIMDALEPVLRASLN